MEFGPKFWTDRTNLSKDTKNRPNLYCVARQPVGYSTDQPLYGILLWGGIGISLGLNIICIKFLAPREIFQGWANSSVSNLITPNTLCHNMREA